MYNQSKHAHRATDLHQAEHCEFPAKRELCVSQILLRSPAWRELLKRVKVARVESHEQLANPFVPRRQRIKYRVSELNETYSELISV